MPTYMVNDGNEHGVATGDAMIPLDHDAPRPPQHRAKRIAKEVPYRLQTNSFKSEIN